MATARAGRYVAFIPSAEDQVALLATRREEIAPHLPVFAPPPSRCALVSDPARLGVHAGALGLRLGRATSARFVVNAAFDAGRPLGLCAHEEQGGRVVTVFEAKPILAALALGESLEITGLVSFEFSEVTGDERGLFRVALGVPASIDVARVAGVDLIGRLLRLARGEVLEPTIAFPTGVSYHWLFQRDARRDLRRAAGLGAVLAPGGVSEVGLDDPPALLFAVRRAARDLSRSLKTYLGKSDAPKLPANEIESAP